MFEIVLISYRVHESNFSDYLVELMGHIFEWIW